MKLKLLTLLVLSAMLCTWSCKKNDDPDPTIGGNRAVILRLDLPGSKTNTRASIEAPITSGVVAGLQKVDIYLYDISTGIVYNTQSLDASQLTAASSANGLQLTNLHANIDAIAIVCNDTGAKDLNISTGEQISVLYSKPMNIALEQNFDNITYTGRDDDLVQVSTPVGGSDDIDYFNASVAVSPLVARVEVSGLVCTDFGTEEGTPSLFTALRLRSVFVENTFSDGINLDYLENAPSAPTTFVATEVPIIGTLSDWWIEILTGSNQNHEVNTTPWSPEYGNPLADGVFAFHIFESATVPTIGLHMDADGGVAENQDMYVRFRTYKDGEGISVPPFEAGNIYQITTPFLETDVKNFDDDPGEINLTITVQEWTIHSNIIAST